MKKWQLEVFCKMLVDKHNVLKNKYSSLETHCRNLDKKIEQLVKEKEALQKKNMDLHNEWSKTEMYKNFQKQNKELRARIRKLEQLRDSLIAENNRLKNES